MEIRSQNAKRPNPTEKLKDFRQGSSVTKSHWIKPKMVSNDIVSQASLLCIKCGYSKYRFSFITFNL